MTHLSDFRHHRATERLGERGWGLPAPEAAPLPAGTVTFLLTDVENSTPRWEASPDQMAAAVGRHYEILDVAVARHGGVRPIEQGEGDSMVAVFALASDAVGAALDAQRALLAEAWPDGVDIAVRMALHTGEARLRDDLYYAGQAIIRCARIRSLGHGGQTLLSATTADLLAGSLPDGTALLPLGVHRLKGLRHPEHVFQLAHPDLPERFPPLRSVDVALTTLPAPLTSFVGRDSELAEAAELVRRHRCVTLVGPGGSGKTRLAIEAAGDAAEANPDGVWWVDLASVSDPAIVPRAVMTAIGLDGTHVEPVTRIGGYLSERQAILVIDNCEHVLDAAAELVSAVLAACPRVTTLATSREALGVTGEVVWRVPPMAMAERGQSRPTGQDLDRMAAGEAVRLFAERAAESRPGFRLRRVQHRGRRRDLQPPRRSAPGHRTGRRPGAGPHAGAHPRRADPALRPPDRRGPRRDGPSPDPGGVDGMELRPAHGGPTGSVAPSGGLHRPVHPRRCRGGDGGRAARVVGLPRPAGRPRRPFPGYLRR